MRVLILCAALLAPVGLAAAALDPAVLQSTAGDWRLSEVGGKVACTLTLTRQSGVGGYEVKAPLACRRAFPPLKTVAAWALDEKGGIVLSDAQAKPIIVFPELTGSPYEAKAPDGRTWRLEPVRDVRASNQRDHKMSGAFRLTGAGGATLCDLTLTADLFGRHGAISAATCAPAWNDKGWTSWSLQDGKLLLAARDGKTILALKPGEAGAFVIADPKADPITLARR
ncbi:MAG: AprI/Inh family metalloprotease inhibitor [Caulobacterales bacterium]